MKNSQIILCKNIKMDKNYNNVLNYSETDLLAICEANKLEKATNYSFVKPNGNAIDVSFSYSNCLKANYIAFQNPYYDNKWFFAFVDSVEYRNNSLTRITFTIDVFSTWFNKISLQTCFVEREHVNDDTIGANTIPEGVERIEAASFSYCEKLKEIHIPSSVTFIQGESEEASSAFMESPNVTIYAPKGSYAEKYAKQENIKFVAE